MSSQQQAALEFARMVGRLKTTPRTGWVRRGVPRYESVADHSWRMTVLSLLLIARKDLDLFHKVLPMALVHDVAEAIVGDIPPEDNVSKEEKLRMELDAVASIAATLKQAVGEEDDSPTASHLLTTLFREYEELETKEAIAVKGLDLLDMIIQADEYERVFDVDLTEFFASTTVDKFRDPTLRVIAEELHKQRAERVTASEKKNNDSNINQEDRAFIEEYAKASTLDSRQIEQVVKALRNWEKKEG